MGRQEPARVHAPVQMACGPIVQHPPAAQHEPTGGHGLGVQEVFAPWYALPEPHAAEVVTAQAPLMLLQHAPVLGGAQPMLPVHGTPGRAARVNDPTAEPKPLTSTKYVCPEALQNEIRDWSEQASSLPAMQTSALGAAHGSARVVQNTCSLESKDVPVQVSTERVLPSPTSVNHTPGAEMDWPPQGVGKPPSSVAPTVVPVVEDPSGSGVAFAQRSLVG